MQKFFNFLVLFVFISGFALAQGNSGESEETLLEKAKALAAEQTPILNTTPPFVGLMTEPTHPLFIGVDATTVPAYFGNVTTNEWIQAFIGYEVWGAAYDNVNDIIYFNSGTVLYEYAVGSGIFTQLGTITDPGGAAQSMVALAFYNGTLYGTKNIANEAVYIINTTTLVATVYIDYLDASFDFGGLAADPTNGDLYGTSDTPPAGLYRINLDGTGTLIVAYPSGQTDIDGLAISSSRIAYFIIDEPGSIFVYDLVGGTYLTPLTNPWTSAEIFSAGTWNSGIIPVELTTFTASVSGNEVNLMWETATEVNNSGFSIERKFAGSEFTEVGFVPGFGTTTEPKSYTFNDQNLHAGAYNYRLKQIDFDGTSTYYDAVEVEILTPANFSLEQNYPNPFNPSTKIIYSIAEAGNVRLSVYNAVGEEIAVLVNGWSEAGQFDATFDASSLPSGIYLYKLQSANFVQTKKMVLLK